MVYNALNYPHLCSFFEELGVEGIDTAMGFSVSINQGELEWCSDSLRGLFATPSNALNPRFYQMLFDIFCFNAEAKKLLSISRTDVSKASMTTGEFLTLHKFSSSFRDLYLVPMTAAIWSASGDDMMNFPAVTLFTFLDK